MSENRHNDTALNHKRRGRRALFKIVPSSLVVLFLLPLLLNYIFELFGYGNRQIFSEYQNLYDSIVKLDSVTLTFIAVQIIALIFAILIHGPKASRQILDNGKGLYVTGLKTNLVLWVWIFLSSIFLAVFFEIIMQKNDSYLIPWLFYYTAPYITVAIIHSLSIAYFIGLSIKKNRTNEENMGKTILF